ncbi:MAG: hypothetical protein KDD44_07110, partial [Bdellovibrionales bacterium]|nr:hypothetical protein [Bdellovibrionales bacterium]
FFAEQYHHGLRILGDLAATDDGAVMRVDRDVRHNEWFLAILVDRMCPTDSEVEVTSPEALDACMTTNSDVGPSLATNIFGLAGEIGDLVLLKRRGDVCDETYIVVQVEHKTACVVHDVEDRGACLVKEQLEIATMYCRLPDEACIILEFTDCVGSLGDCNLEFTLTVSCCGISG